jgi:hypothetical protein
MPAAQMQTKAMAERRELAKELLDLHRKHADTFGRIDDIKSARRKIATDAGENFKEEFADGESVGGPRRRVQGDPAGGRRALRKGARQNHQKGIIKMTLTYGKPNYGSVTVDVF